MAISFEQSLKQAAEAKSVPAALDTAVVEDYAIAPAMPMIATYGIATLSEENDLIAAYSGEDPFELVPGYEVYNNFRNGEFADINYSQINEAKEIIINGQQYNITQESNSQYIPFEMPRYYDGIDLSVAEITVHYTTKKGVHRGVPPINVERNTRRIRFGWLVDSVATSDAGELTIEVHAIGTLTSSEGNVKAYLWKTQSNKELTVLQTTCVCDKDFNQLDEGWLEDLIERITTSFAEEIKEVAVGEQVEAAERAASNAAQSARDASEYASAAEGYYNDASTVATEAAQAVLENYVTNDQLQGVSNRFENYVEKTYLANNYYTIQQADDRIKAELEPYAAKADYYDKTKTDQRIATELEPYMTGDEVMEAIKAEDITAKLDKYYQKSETYNQDEIDALLKTVTVDMTGYATEKFVTDTTSKMSSNISKNTGDIASLNEVVKGLQEDIKNVDTDASARTYDVAYNDVEDPNVGENVFVLYEIENEGTEQEVKTAKKKFTIVGGSGTSTSSVLKIEYVTKTPYVATKGSTVELSYIFSGTDSSGVAVQEGTATWKVAGTTVATELITAGENTFDVSKYVNVGTQKVLLSVVDDNGSLATRSWTVQVVDVRVDSSFDDKLTYDPGNLDFNYTPYGAIEKTVHFELNGDEIGTTTTGVSGISMPFTLTGLEHGSYLLKVYMTATISGNDIRSNEIYKDILILDKNKTSPIIGCAMQEFTAKQYDTTQIVYTVYDPKTAYPTVTLAVDGEVVKTSTLTSSATDTWQYKSADLGEHILTITCGETVKTLKATITELGITITPVTTGLVFDFNPIGYSNSDTDRMWSDGDIKMTTSDNFDWINGGYQSDENGDQFFCVKAGTQATISYQLFADDAKKNGKEFKLVFKTTNVAKPDATFLSCVDNTNESDHIGIQMNVHDAQIYGQAGCLDLSYSEEDIIEFEFNISKDNEDVPMVMGYEDGVSTRPMVYDSSFNFTQNTPKEIVLGSNDCDLHIYRMKVYNTSMNAKGILNNFIADARNADEMISRYNRNQIYDENQMLDPDVLAQKCPWLRVYKVSAPYFTNNKSDKVPGTTIQQIYKDGDPTLDNWTCYDCQHSGQGTSSNNYGAAGRNLDFIMNKSGVDGVKPYFIMGDGSRAEKITMTRKSVPVAYLNVKVNIASSNNMTNAMLANRYNEFNPYKRPFVRGEGVDTSFIKDTMEFANCVIFIKETNEDLSTHREFADTSWHFYAIGNIGDSKKTDETRLTDMNDKYECCVEIMDVELPLSDFPADTMMNAMGYTVDETTEEKTYTWAKNENLGILYEKIDGEYVLTEDTEVDLDKVYYVDILEHDDFSEDYTYGWRYLYEGDDDEENTQVFEYCKQKWIEFYRFVTTATEEEFKARISNYIILDSVLYYYLFTNRYCLADNRAKNLFFHYGKTNEVDQEGNPIRKWDLTWGYDMDTALGLNNYGKQAYRYGLEDIDVDEKGEEVFRESDSTFFCRIRDCFKNELKAMYNTLESKNAWHAESFINKADEWQDQFPEELWRLDIERKYIRTYTGSFINGKGDSQFLANMANGKMKYHRRQWERSQEKYMASKYQSPVASSDNAVFRCTVPDGDLAVQPNYRLKLTPYAYMYLNVKYGTQSPIQLRAEPNVTYEIPFTGEKTDILDVYSASIIQDFGDLSTCYVATADTSKAEKVKQLIFGNDTEGYDNPSFTELTTGANGLLETLNIENISGITQSLDLKALHNLRNLYAHGSNISGVVFADGGKLEVAELPAVSSLSMKNLAYLKTLDVADYSKLAELTVENCPTVDLIGILDSATEIKRARLVGIDWSLENTGLLTRLYDIKGLDQDNHNLDRAVLTGKVHVTTIRQRDFELFQIAWPDLQITYESMIEQVTVTFMNADGSVIEVQYVDKGENAVDPTTRENDPVIPTMPSSVSHDFTFSNWDVGFDKVMTDRVVTAVYSQSLRSYKIQYKSKGVVLPGYPVDGLYGDNIIYTGDIPAYTAEESAFKYYLFDRWDKSGYLDGDFDENGIKTVNAIFSEYEYTDGDLDNVGLENMTPVQIYAVTKLVGAKILSTRINDDNRASEAIYRVDSNGDEIDIIGCQDSFSFVIGNDVDYDDIPSLELIKNAVYVADGDNKGKSTIFDGNSYIDTGIKLLDDDKDFVFAIDYEFEENNADGAILMQCYQENGKRGFRFYYANNSSDDSSRFYYNGENISVASAKKREMLVIQHRAGQPRLTVYRSFLDGENVSVAPIEVSTTALIDSNLIFGASNPEDGYYENRVRGTVNWAKIWYKDLGDEMCKSLAMWTHEAMKMEVCSFRKYYLGDDSGRCSFSLLASHLLSRNMKWNLTNTTVGGFANSNIHNILNGRLLNSIPTQIKALMKQVKIYSTSGALSTDPLASNCYIAIPSVLEVDSTKNFAPYNDEGTHIAFMSSNSARERAYSDGTKGSYWTRSPNALQSGTNYYVYCVEYNKSYNTYGYVQSIKGASASLGVLMMISF